MTRRRTPEECGDVVQREKGLRLVARLHRVSVRSAVTTSATTRGRRRHHKREAPHPWLLALECEPRIAGRDREDVDRLTMQSATRGEHELLISARGLPRAELDAHPPFDRPILLLGIIESLKLIHERIVTSPRGTGRHRTCDD